MCRFRKVSSHLYRRPSKIDNFLSTIYRRAPKKGELKKSQKGPCQAISECNFRVSRQAIQNVTRGYMCPYQSVVEACRPPAGTPSPRGAQPAVRQLVKW